MSEQEELRAKLQSISAVIADAKSILREHKHDRLLALVRQYGTSILTFAASPQSALAGLESPRVEEVAAALATLHWIWGPSQLRHIPEDSLLSFARAVSTPLLQREALYSIRTLHAASSNIAILRLFATLINDPAVSIAEKAVAYE